MTTTTLMSLNTTLMSSIHVVIVMTVSDKTQWSFMLYSVLGSLSCGPVSTPGLAVGPLAENVISHHSIEMTASYGYKAFKSPAVVCCTLTEAHADTFIFISA